MLNSIIPVISSIPFLVSVILGTILTAFIFWLRADNFRFTAFAYKRPWVWGNNHSGEFQKLSIQSLDSVVGPDKLVDAERTLCSTFKGAISGSPMSEVSETQFNNAKNYLKITMQNDIHRPSMVAQIGLFLLILAESVGTGYVLAPWMSTEITPSQANVAAGVLALSVAIVLALITHATGAEMAQFWRYRKNSGSEGLDRTIDLGENQDVDAFFIDPNNSTVRPNPTPRRFSNRVMDPGGKGPVLLIISTLIIIAIMVAIFEIRAGGIDSQATMQVASFKQNNSGDASDPFSTASQTPLPPDAVAAQNDYKDKVAKTLSDDYRKQGIAASIMLALIYLVTQFTAFIIAAKTTFSGQGQQAYEFTRNMQSFETFKAKFLQPKIARAEGFLAQLRAVRQKGNHRCGTGTFNEYLKLGADQQMDKRFDLITSAVADISNAKNDEDRKLRWELALKNYNFDASEQAALVEECEAAIQKLARIGSAAMPRTVAAPAQPAAPAPVQAPAPTTAPATPVAKAVQTQPSNVAEIAKAFLHITDKADKIAFLQGQEQQLDPAIFDALKAEIKKQQEAAKAADRFSDLID